MLNIQIVFKIIQGSHFEREVGTITKYEILFNLLYTRGVQFNL